MKTLLLAVSLFLGLAASAQPPKLTSATVSAYKVGRLVKEFASKHNMLRPTTIISDNNISTVTSNSQPDVRCFNAKGEELLTLNCMAGIRFFVDSVNRDKVSLKPNGESLQHYLTANTMLDLDGKPLQQKDLPLRKYYIFYSYQYSGDKTISPALEEAFRTLNKAHEELDNTKAIFYDVCITGIAINNMKLIH